METKAILFDLDGILVDSEPLHFEAHRFALEKCGIKITKDDYIQNGVSGGKRSFYEVMQMKYGKTVDIDEVRQLRKEKFGELIEENVKTFEGIEELLEKMNKSYRLAVVSNTPLKYIEKILERAGIRSYFEIISSAKDLQYAKPYPDVYFDALKKLGLSAKECIAIEDSKNGVEAAKGAGIKCYAVPNEFTRSQDLSNADEVLNSIELVTDFLEKQI